MDDRRWPYLEVTLVPAVLGQGVPEVLVTPHGLEHVRRCLRLPWRLAEGKEGRWKITNEARVKGRREEEGGRKE